MSILVIERLVVPVVRRISPWTEVDEELKQYLEEELGRIYALAGGISCPELEKTIRRQLKIYPKGFEEIVHELLRKHVGIKKRKPIGVA